jgi:hypothetical protein
MIQTDAAQGVDLSTVRTYLDEALLGLRAIADPEVRVRDVERDLAAGLLAVYRAHASRGDASEFSAQLRTALERTRSALTVLQATPTADGGTAAEMQKVALSIRALMRASAAPDTGPPPSLPRPTSGPPRPLLRATRREPALLELERSILYPAIPLPEIALTEPPPAVEEKEPPPIVDAAQLEALLAEVQATLGAAEEEDEKDEKEKKPPKEEEGAARPAPLGPPIDEELEREYVGVRVAEPDLVFERARSCFEDLGMFSLMRKPLEGQTWTGRDKPERRLLARIDAVAACGAWVLPRLVKILEERPLPDPELTWAAIFLFGSIAGDDALDQTMRLVRVAPLDVPAMATAVADALSLAPHPAIADALRPWLGDADPARRAVAAGVLTRRGAITLDEARRATRDPDKRVVLEGARALAVAFGRLDDFDFEGVLAHKEPAIAAAAMTAATLRKREAGVRRALSLTAEGQGAFADAAMLVAVGARQDALDALRADAAAAGSPVTLEALGWFGSVAVVDYLIGRLRADEPAAVAAAADALQRITDASLTDDVPDPVYAPGDRPFVRFFRPPTVVAELSKNPDIWGAWWKKHRANAKETTRYRFGHAWTPLDSLWELECAWAAPRERAYAHLEIVSRTSVDSPFDAQAFVARQEAQLREIRAAIETPAARAHDGTWATSFVR